jgi:PKD repeat protein
MDSEEMRTGKIVIFSVLTVLLAQAFASSITSCAPALTVDMDVSTNKESYCIRERVALNGTLLEQGQPATGYVVAVQVTNRNGYSLLYRTVSIGDTSGRWPIETTEITITDGYYVPNDTARINSMVNLIAKIKNTQLNEYSLVVAVTLLDGNLVPVYTQHSTMTIASLETRAVTWSAWIPEWAYGGKALAVINVYSSLPKNGGTPLALEAQHTFYITRVPGILYPYSQLPIANTSSSGQYGIYFRMPPDQYTLPGNYVADAVAVSVSTPLYRTSSSTSFELLDYSAPPTADFSYNPLFIYQNMTVTFDAIGSSANGYNDTIIGYDWTINDPYDPVHITETPPDSTVTHAFSHLGTFTVQVNVTDSEGLWATSMKPVNILPEFDPQANFTHVPITPVINQTATFNASQSQPGWSAQLAAYAPIVSYTWDWNDGTPNNVTSLSSMTHKFTAINNYTVTLTVADSIGRVNSVNALIQVVNRSLYDLNGDGTIDIKDISIVAKAFGTQPGDPLWNPIADINGDSLVDIKDVSAVAKHYGETF